MARTLALSQKELKRVAAAAYEGKGIRVMLCSVASTGYTAESTVSNWQSAELSGNGYARVSATVGTGAYDGTAAAYLLPDVDAIFTASGAGLTWDRVVVYFNGETYVHSVTTESPAVSLVSGQSITYRVSLNTDD
jgi:hypothetical protein